MSYVALENTTNPDALIVMAPGQFTHDSSNLASVLDPWFQRL